MNHEMKKRNDGALPAPKPADDIDRLVMLHGLCILDTGKDERFDRITTLVSEILDVPIVLVSLVDESREWFKSTVGTDIVEIDRDHGFCAHGILQQGDNPFIVVDSLADARFSTHPFVVAGPKLRFYCGAPLMTASGHKIGMLCVHDLKPRPDFGDQQKHMLKKFAEITMDEINFHRNAADRKMLIGELSHRVKNYYSTISSMARTSLKKGQSAAEYVESFTDRIAAMSAAHDKLVDSAWEEVTVAEVAQSVIGAHQNADGSKFIFDIPNLSVDVDLTQTLALCIHELMINSIKYGALKIPSGQVFLSVVRHVEAHCTRDCFVWREVGGTPPEIPTHRGFGHRMLDSALQSGGGKILFDWRTEGLICEFELVTKT